MSETTEAPRKLTAAELEERAGRRAIEHRNRSREQEESAGRHAASQSPAAQSNDEKSPSKTEVGNHEAGQQIPQPEQQIQQPEQKPDRPQFETVTVDMTKRDGAQGENTQTQGSAPNAGQETAGDKVHRNPANNPDQALVATADNDADAGEEAREVQVMDRDHGEQNAGPMVAVDTTKTGPSGAVIGQDNREAVERADERQQANEAFNAKADQDQADRLNETNPNVATADTVKPEQTDAEKAREQKAAADQKAARDKAAAKAEAKRQREAEAAKKDDKTSAVDDVLK